MMNSPVHGAHESFKDTLGHLWNNKPLFFTVVAGVAVGGFILYKNSNAAVIAPAGTATSTSDTPGLNGGTYTNISTITNTTTTVQPPTSVVPPPVVLPGPIGHPLPPGPVGIAGKNYGLVPYGKYNGPSYSNLKPNTFFTWAGIKYLLFTGPQGKLYGKDPSGAVWLLYEPASFYPGGTNYGK